MKTCECGCGEIPAIAPRTDAAAGYTRGEPRKFVNGHQRRKSSLEWLEDENGCWIWQRAIADTGYGSVTAGSAHRAVYERMRGSIPAGLHLDHLCCVRACVNPDHLEPVTPAENVRRAAALRTHCKHGHEFTPKNTYLPPGRNARQCRTCASLREQGRRRQSA